MVFDTWLIGNARGELGVDRTRLPRSASLLAGILLTAIAMSGREVVLIDLLGSRLKTLSRHLDAGAQRCEAGRLSHHALPRAG